MMKQLSTLCFLLALMACQNKKPVEISQEDWITLQKETVEHLREKSFGIAADNLKRSMSLAGDDMNRWEYTRMGLASLPPDLALPMVETALKHKKVKNNDEQLFGYSKVYTQFKQLEPALKVVNKAIDIKRKEDYVFWRARLYLMLKKYVLAEQDYLWLIDKDDSKEAYISQYASLLNHLDRTNEAQQLLEAHKDNPDLLYKSIILALRSDDELEAKKQFTQIKTVLLLDDMDDQKKIEIGELAYWLDDYDYSLNVLNSVKSGDHISQAKLIMGQVLMKQEAYERAVILFRQAQNGAQEHAVLAYLLEADAHRELDEAKQGIRSLTQALSQFPNHSDILYSRAMLYESVKKLNDMEKDLQIIIANDTSHYDALNALGYSWADRNIKLDEALTLIEKAHELAPKNIAILDSLGWVNYRLGNFDQARHYLELATEDTVADKLMLEHLLEVLETIGDEAAAQVVKQQLSEMI